MSRSSGAEVRFHQLSGRAVLLFHRAIKGIEKHEALIVSRIERGALIARNERGEERIFTAKQARFFSLHERKGIDIASGDKPLLIGNRRDADLRATNGELVKVRSIESRRIQLEDGRTLPDNYREFDHGYAITAHRSQGKTVDSVIVSADAMKQELVYVASSRGRQEIAVATSDKERLRESMGISTARPSAMELVKELAQQHDASQLGPEKMPAQRVRHPEPPHEIGHGYGFGPSL